MGDFGIARKLENVTGGLSQKGTYNYMAPAENPDIKIVSADKTRAVRQAKQSSDGTVAVRGVQQKYDVPATTHRDFQPMDTNRADTFEEKKKHDAHKIVVVIASIMIVIMALVFAVIFTFPSILNKKENDVANTIEKTEETINKENSEAKEKSDEPITESIVVDEEKLNEENNLPKVPAESIHMAGYSLSIRLF